MRILRYLVLIVLGVVNVIAQDSSSPPVVWNCGHGGDNSQNLINRFDRDVLSKNPHLIVLLVGTNDSLNSQNAISPEIYESNLRTLVKKAQTAGAAVLLVTIPPCYPPYLFKRHPADFYGSSGPNGKIVELNHIIRRMGESMKIPVADVHAIYERDGNVGEDFSSYLRNKANSASEDGVHPTSKGYEVIATLVSESIIGNNLPKTEIVCLGDSITYGIGTNNPGATEGDSYPAKLKQILSTNNH